MKLALPLVTGIHNGSHLPVKLHFGMQPLYLMPCDSCDFLCMLQDLDERIVKVINNYKERLTERTKHHLG